MSGTTWLLAWLLWLGFTAFCMVSFSVWFWLLLFMGPSIRRVVENTHTNQSYINNNKGKGE